MGSVFWLGVAGAVAVALALITAGAVGLAWKARMVAVGCTWFCWICCACLLTEGGTAGAVPTAWPEAAALASDWNELPATAGCCWLITLLMTVVLWMLA